MKRRLFVALAVIALSGCASMDISEIGGGMLGGCAIGAAGGVVVGAPLEGCAAGAAVGGGIAASDVRREKREDRKEARRMARKNITLCETDPVYVNGERVTPEVVPCHSKYAAPGFRNYPHDLEKSQYPANEAASWPKK